MFEKITDEQVKKESKRISNHCRVKTKEIYGEDYNSSEALKTIITTLMNEIVYQRFQIEELSEKPGN